MKKLAALIIEDRFFEDFGKTCYDHMKYLPEGTDLYVYTSEENKPKYDEQLINYKINATFLNYNQNKFFFHCNRPYIFLAMEKLFYSTLQRILRL